MRDEDLDSCPQCGEDMWTGQSLCKNCQFEEDVDDMLDDDFPDYSGLTVNDPDWP